MRDFFGCFEPSMDMLMLDFFGGYMGKGLNTENRKTKYFGTDGFRGEFGRELTVKHAYIIGRFLGESLCRGDGTNPRILIGRDTRLSSPMLEAAICAGLGDGGGEAFLAGVITTPGLAFATKNGDFDGGVIITASHNPYTDNGIKLFDRDGIKVADELIFELEKFIDESLKLGLFDESYAPIGRAYPEAREAYVRWLTEGKIGSLSGLKIGLDTANGAATEIGDRVFRMLGAEVHKIGGEPDGRNINAGVGSTHPEALAELVTERGLDFGFAFDGDGDRCITIGKGGKIIDGDSEMFILASGMKERGELKNNTVVATVMSNSGFVNSLRKIGIEAAIVTVGDRFVSEKMREGGYTLGGEQSGHIIIGDGAFGDGIFTAISLATLMKKSGDTELLLSDLEIYPQLMSNVKVRDKGVLMEDARVTSMIKELSEKIGTQGRILLRPSGTENLIRVMIEHKNPDKCKLYLEIILDFLEKWKIDNER